MRLCGAIFPHMHEQTLDRRYGAVVPSSVDLDRSEERWEDLPHDELVALLRSSIENAKVEWEASWGEGSFDPIIWIGEKLTNKLFPAFGSPRSQAQNLSYAWDALTQPYIKSPTYRDIVSGIIRDVSRVHGRYITLPPKGVKLLDAMTEAVNVRVPRARGEQQVDLFANIPALIKGHRPLP